MKSLVNVLADVLRVLLGVALILGAVSGLAILMLVPAMLIITFCYWWFV